jgi:hypothetical protein
MKTSSKFLTFFLICLFLALSFNAYACLVPILGDMQILQGNDCSTPGKEPITQFCDGFKTLAVQTGADTSSAHLFNLVLTGNLLALYSDPVTTGQFPLTPRIGDLSPPQDILLLISVFRI